MLASADTCIATQKASIGELEERCRNGEAELRSWEADYYRALTLLNGKAAALYVSHRLMDVGDACLEHRAMQVQSLMQQLHLGGQQLKAALNSAKDHVADKEKLSLLSTQIAERDEELEVLHAEQATWIGALANLDEVADEMSRWRHDNAAVAGTPVAKKQTLERAGTVQQALRLSLQKLRSVLEQYRPEGVDTPKADDAVPGDIIDSRSPTSNGLAGDPSKPDGTETNGSAAKSLPSPGESGLDSGVDSTMPSILPAARDSTAAGSTMTDGGVTKCETNSPADSANSANISGQSAAVTPTASTSATSAPTISTPLASAPSTSSPPTSSPTVSLPLASASTTTAYTASTPTPSAHTPSAPTPSTPSTSAHTANTPILGNSSRSRHSPAATKPSRPRSSSGSPTRTGFTLAGISKARSPSQERSKPQRQKDRQVAAWIKFGRENPDEVPSIDADLIQFGQHRKKKIMALQMGAGYRVMKRSSKGGPGTEMDVDEVQDEEL